MPATPKWMRRNDMEDKAKEVTPYEADTFLSGATVTGFSVDLYDMEIYTANGILNIMPGDNNTLIFLIIEKVTAEYHEMLDIPQNP